MKRLGSDSETVPKPNVLLVDRMYGERQEQWQTLRTVARHASQVVKSTKVQLSSSYLPNRHMKDQVPKIMSVREELVRVLQYIN